MNPLALLGGGGMSVSDSTAVTFNPFADQGKTTTNSINVKSGLQLNADTLVPIAIILVVGYLLYRLLK